MKILEDVNERGGEGERKGEEERGREGKKEKGKRKGNEIEGEHTWLCVEF
jgi:hypothetical protein